MAPKAPPAGAPAAGGGTLASEDLKKRFSAKVIWRILAAFGGSSFILMIVMIAIYAKMSREPPDPLAVPMQHLQGTMANSLRRPKLNYVTAVELAEEVGLLPEKLEETQTVLQQQKEVYKALFKSKAKSTGSWENFGNNLYYISQGEKSWYDAENFCVSRDAHLASILTKEEQSFITSHLDEPAWIGLTDEHEEGSWEWTDGSRLISHPKWYSPLLTPGRSTFDSIHLSLDFSAFSAQ
ncbi:C-type lectin domain family 10 member A-like isoform X2 [Varanus komodoensis]|uniref:C-type lectin domain family 10 member A-like isoform X2 n=1 Tax=Varanus komodoensis TaxID=61221 RepID=UPI001CF7A985|nr:C-type lectin domain family 10 member A-like isoform X2 [Varanus komodoensis]